MTIAAALLLALGIIMLSRAERMDGTQWLESIVGGSAVGLAVYLITRVRA